MNQQPNRSRPIRPAAALVAAALATAVAAPAAAGPGRAQTAPHALGPVGGPGSMLPLLLRSIDLSDSQRAEIKAIVASHRTRIGKLFARLGDAQRDLADHLYSADAVTEATVEARIQEVQRLRTELLREGIAAVLEARAVLTGEQIETMAGTSRRYRDLRAEMSDLFRPVGDGDATAGSEAPTD